MRTATTIVLLALATVAAAAPSLRFGINVAGQVPAGELAELGVGRVRFENLKWPMVSPAPGEFAYDGSVAPWHVKVDEILAGYTAAGIEVLPFLFQTAGYASTAPDGTKPSQVYSYPPKDDAGYAGFVWQTLARFGSVRHGRPALQTADGKSGLGHLKTVELWNEPNLNAPEWGPWVADMPRYFELFRAGAEAAVRADPAVRVSHGGFAGIGIDTVDQLATYRYADGRTPLDFTDIINVHYYSGRTRPERASGDPNTDRDGAGAGPWDVGTYEDQLRRLVHWRDEIAPGKPIWMTETGYDTAGPYGITEAEQAARLPRCVMLALAAGVESVFVYREKGSAPGQHAASGLVRDDGTKKPAWAAYRTLAAQLGGWSGRVKALHGGRDDVRVFAWSTGNGYVVSAWAVEGTAPLGIEFGACVLTGASVAAREQGPTAELELTESPVYLTFFQDIRKVLRITANGKETRPPVPRGDPLASRHAMLFDFGGTAKVKTFDLGRHRRFMPVAKGDTFTPQRTYGFVPGAAMADGYRKWIPDFADCDSCRLPEGTGFRFKVPPGRYTVRAGGTALSDTPVTATLSQADKPVAALTIGKDATAEAVVDFGPGDVTLQPDGYLDLRWLTIVRKAD